MKLGLVSDQDSYGVDGIADDEDEDEDADDAWYWKVSLCAERRFNTSDHDQGSRCGTDISLPGRSLGKFLVYLYECQVYEIHICPYNIWITPLWTAQHSTMWWQRPSPSSWYHHHGHAGDGDAGGNLISISPVKLAPIIRKTLNHKRRRRMARWRRRRVVERGVDKTKNFLLPCSDRQGPIFTLKPL